MVRCFWRLSEESFWASVSTVVGASLSATIILEPVRECLKKLREREPYDFRVPIPMELVEAMCGLSVCSETFTWLSSSLYRHIAGCGQGRR